MISHQRSSREMNEIPQAANRVVGDVGLGRSAVDRVVGAELSVAR